jgi:hypothetical protein
MRTSRPALLLCLCWLIPVSVSAQQPASAGSSSGSQSSQGATLLQQARTALIGGVQISDVTLIGTTTVPIHPGAQSGSIVLVATANGRAQITLTSSAGVDTETDDYSGGPHIENYSGPDGVAHTTPSQGLPPIHPAWFFPTFILATGSSASNLVASDMGQGVWSGVAVRHLALWNPLSPHDSQHDFYLDPSSLLPIVMVFKIHAFDPNNPGAPLRATRMAPAEVEEEVHYSNYQSVQGVAVPFHIQFYIRGTLVNDILISSARINTGVNLAAVN